MASQLTRAEVMRIAELARLEVTEEEAATFARQLTSILEYAESIQRVDTSRVDAAALPAGDPISPLREDSVLPSLDRSSTVATAPESSTDGAFFKVPKVL
jgi:aspartyl-tRNA(Asn)/glutamyl-tRNA(Gln) amidotransferase subunit C